MVGADVAGIDRVLGGCQPAPGQRRQERLADELHPVQRADRGQHVRGIGPLPAAGAQQPGTGQPLQDRLQDLLFQAVPDKAGAEVPEDGEV
jgi:hypothetical protein